MRQNRLFIIAVVLVLSIGAVLFTSNALRAESDSSGAVLGKLDEIISGQRSMMQDIAFIKEELKIIKIRITQQQ